MSETGEKSRDISRWSLRGMTALVTGGSKGLGSVQIPHISYAKLIIIIDFISQFNHRSIYNYIDV